MNKFKNITQKIEKIIQKDIVPDSELFSIALIGSEDIKYISIQGDGEQLVYLLTETMYEIPNFKDLLKAAINSYETDMAYEQQNTGKGYIN